MFSTIFKYELEYWLKQPAVYIYAAIFLFSAMFLTQGASGGWDASGNADRMVEIANSPLKINWFITFFSQLILFLTPAIIGLSIYRDFKSNMHTVLYSYPFTKGNYLFAKFSNAFLILTLIVSTIGIGVFIGMRLPGIPPENIGPTFLSAYFQTYLVYVIPNLFIFGAIIFAVVTLTRNIYAGFIIIILLFFVQALFNSLVSGLENQYAAALFDPFGKQVVNYLTQYWTLAEKNSQAVPITNLVILNRLLWCFGAGILFSIVYQSFSFSQNAAVLSFGKKNKRQIAKQNPGSIIKVKLPSVSFDFSFWQTLKTSWRLSNVELRYIFKSWMFISILLAGALAIFFQQAQLNPQNGFKVLPVTWLMLRIPTLLFSGVINVLTFLYAGMLVTRGQTANMQQLVDVTPIPNWAMLFSKFLALLKMQAILLFLIMAGGITAQAIRGYYNFEIGHYLFELYGMNFLGFIIWAMAALFIQTLVRNPYLGLFLLVFGGLGMAALPNIGIRHFVFRFNLSPELDYSDMNGYGAYLKPFFIYKFYWGLSAISLFFITLLIWQRGLFYSLKERVQIAKSRFHGKTALAISIALIAFLAMGAGIYYEDTVLHKNIRSNRAAKKLLAAADKKYKQSYEHFVQPRIMSLNVNLDIFPEERRFQAEGEYLLVNKSAQNIDTLIVSSGFDEKTRFHFDRETASISSDSAAKFDVLALSESLAPGDSLRCFFSIENAPNSLFQRNSNVLHNGTFLGSDIFPRFHYRTERAPLHPAEKAAPQNNYQSLDSDLINFEATLSTSADQIAIAPGYLQKEWRENGRRYFQYKMDHPIKFAFGFNSGKFEVLREKYGDVSLEIYYHKAHDHNLERMLRGLKAALDYNSKHFSPYQHRQARIIEFPLSEGSHATTFANSIPFSEYRFITEVNDADPKSIDLPFYVAAHELSHQWWGNQVIPAGALGAKMITESISEYATLKMMAKAYGPEKSLQFLKNDRHRYLRGRANARDNENPLMLVDRGQEYIAYGKGALVFYALANYIGEENLNQTLKRFLEGVKFQGSSYPTSLELVKMLREATPPHLQYLIKDMFETVTLYDNRLTDVAIQPMSNGKYRVDIEFLISKYRSGEGGKRIYEDAPGEMQSWQSAETRISSLPLEDYIEIGIFGKQTRSSFENEILYLKKHKIRRIDNRMTFIVDEKPAAVSIDPHLLLIDINIEDNRLTVDGER